MSRTALREWIAVRVRLTVADRDQPIALGQIVAKLQDDVEVLAIGEVLENRKDFELTRLVQEALAGSSVPSHASHLYAQSGIAKRAAWVTAWDHQRREDRGEAVVIEPPPAYDSRDFLRPEYWRLRGTLDVPKEMFVAFTEVPGKTGIETLYGDARWTPLQRLKALLRIDEQLEDASVPLADRVGVLDSAWRLLPDAVRDDAAVAARLKAELQALVGPDGPSRELVQEWQKRFPPPNSRAPRPRKSSALNDDRE